MLFCQLDTWLWWFVACLWTDFQQLRLNTAKRNSMWSESFVKFPCALHTYFDLSLFSSLNVSSAYRLSILMYTSIRSCYYCHSCFLMFLKFVIKLSGTWEEKSITVITFIYSHLFLLFYSAVAWCGKLNAIACASETCARIPRSD